MSYLYIPLYYLRSKLQFILPFIDTYISLCTEMQIVSIYIASFIYLYLKSQNELRRKEYRFGVILWELLQETLEQNMHEFQSMVN